MHEETIRLKYLEHDVDVAGEDCDFAIQAAEEAWVAYREALKKRQAQWDKVRTLDLLCEVDW